VVFCDPDSEDLGAASCDPDSEDLGAASCDPDSEDLGAASCDPDSGDLGVASCDPDSGDLGVASCDPDSGDLGAVSVCSPVVVPEPLVVPDWPPLVDVPDPECPPVVVPDWSPLVDEPDPGCCDLSVLVCPHEIAIRGIEASATSEPKLTNNFFENIDFFTFPQFFIFLNKLINKSKNKRGKYYLREKNKV
nr:hypothetical protein - Mycoplasma hyorhinis [Mesomycoplasma hyorhinis]